VGVLREFVGDEPAVLLELVDCFETVATGLRAGLLRAGADSDADGAAMLAHSLKSSSRSVGALPLGASCARLEAHGARFDLPVGIAVNAGRADRSFYAGTLGALAEGAVEFVDGPADILVGRAVAHGDRAQAASAAADRCRVA